MNSSERDVDISPKLNFLEIELVFGKFADAVERLTFPTKKIWIYIPVVLIYWHQLFQFCSETIKIYLRVFISSRALLLSVFW